LISPMTHFVEISDRIMQPCNNPYCQESTRCFQIRTVSAACEIHIVASIYVYFGLHAPSRVSNCNRRNFSERLTGFASAGFNDSFQTRQIQGIVNASRYQYQGRAPPVPFSTPNPAYMHVKIVVESTAQTHARLPLHGGSSHDELKRWTKAAEAIIVQKTNSAKTKTPEDVRATPE
jgi:hypothetical protein